MTKPGVADGQTWCYGLPYLVYLSGTNILILGQWGQVTTPGVPDDAEDHDLLQALIHVPGGHTEDVNGVWIILGTHTAPRAGLNSCTTCCLLIH